MNLREIKNQITYEPQSLGEEKYKIGAVGQIIETIRFILFRDDSFTRGQSIFDDSVTRGQSPISVTGHWYFIYSVLELLYKEWTKMSVS